MNVLIHRISMSDLRSNYLRGAALAGGGMLVISPDSLLLRLLQDAGPWEMIFYRSLFTGLVLWAVLIGRDRRLIPRPRGGIDRYLWASVACVAITAITFIIAITETTVANTLVLVAAMPLFGAAFGYFMIGERLSRRTWIAIFVAFGGILIIFHDSLGGGGWFGDLMAALTAMVMGLNLVILRRRPGLDIMYILAIAGLITGCAVLPFADVAAVSGRDLIILVVLGGLIMPLSLGLFYGGTRYIPAGEVALWALIETVLGPLWVWIGIGEQPSPLALLGGSVIVGAVAANALLALKAANGAVKS